MQNNPLRTLARSSQYQVLYLHIKNLNGNLFENNLDFSYIQLLFLQWIEIYHNLYLDISSNEQLIDNSILEDDILVDAYLYYKKMKNKKDGEQSQLPIKGNSCKIPSLTFVRRRKNK